jgi:CheY-like chemotaxis protein
MLPLPTRDQFVALVADAYTHLYDLAYLGNQASLLDLLLIDTGARRKDRAWRLQQMLLDTIDDLNPGLRAPAFSREWRLHRLMTLRHVDGLDPQAIADQIGVSRRHFYREQQAAVEHLADLLFSRRVPHLASEDAAPPHPPAPAAGRLDALREEAARIAQPGASISSVKEMIEDALALAREMLRHRGATVRLDIAPDLPAVSANPNLTRQLILGALGLLTDRQPSALAAREQPGGKAVRVTFLAQPGGDAGLPAEDGAAAQTQWAELAELAELAGAALTPIVAGSALAGFELSLPVAPRRTLLIVDDNQDVLDLIARYAGLHGYQARTVRGVSEGLALALALRPDAITLDLMMPEQDGWRALQALKNHPGTRGIPVIVCSVLNQKDLALSLGAAACVQKPISEQALLAALAEAGLR